MEEKRKEFLSMYGGIWGGMVPLAILIVGLVWFGCLLRNAAGQNLFGHAAGLRLQAVCFLQKIKPNTAKPQCGVSAIKQA